MVFLPLGLQSLCSWSKDTVVKPSGKMSYNSLESGGMADFSSFDEKSVRLGKILLNELQIVGGCF